MYSDDGLTESENLRDTSRSKSAVWAIDSSKRPTPSVAEVRASTLLRSFLTFIHIGISAGRGLPAARKELGHSLGHLAESSSEDRSDVPGRREDGGIFLFVRLEHSSEPREPSRDVVELACLGGGAKDAAIVAQEEERIPFQEGVPAEVRNDEQISSRAICDGRCTWRLLPRRRRRGKRRSTGHPCLLEPPRSQSCASTPAVS